MWVNLVMELKVSHVCMMYVIKLAVAVCTTTATGLGYKKVDSHTCVLIGNAPVPIFSSTYAFPGLPIM